MKCPICKCELVVNVGLLRFICPLCAWWVEANSGKR